MAANGANALIIDGQVVAGPKYSKVSVPVSVHFYYWMCKDAPGGGEGGAGGAKSATATGGWERIAYTRIDVQYLTTPIRTCRHVAH